MARKKKNISRRSFGKAAAAFGVSLTTALHLSGCSSQEKSADTKAESYALKASDNEALFVLKDFEQKEETFEPTQTFTLDPGIVLHPCEGEWSAATLPAKTHSPHIQAAALSLKTGKMSVVVKNPYLNRDTSLILDVACSDHVYAWSEYDYVQNIWVLYASQFSNGKLSGDSVQLMKQDAQTWEVPQFVCSADKVIWYLMPKTSGSHASDASKCFYWQQGMSSAQEISQSQGQFGAAPCVSGQKLILTPRMKTKSSYSYILEVHDLSHIGDAILNAQIPSPIRPFAPTIIDDKLVFCVEAPYNSGDLFSKMGTYIQQDNGRFIALSRQPESYVCGTQKQLIVKVGASYFVIYPQEKKYSILASVNNALDYGDYPLRSGACELFATYATVKDPVTSKPTKTVVRTYQLAK